MGDQKAQENQRRALGSRLGSRACRVGEAATGSTWAQCPGLEAQFPTVRELSSHSSRSLTFAIKTVIVKSEERWAHIQHSETWPVVLTS